MVHAIKKNQFVVQNKQVFFLVSHKYKMQQLILNIFIFFFFSKLTIIKKNQSLYLF